MTILIGLIILGTVVALGAATVWILEKLHSAKSETADYEFLNNVLDQKLIEIKEMQKARDRMAKELNDN